MSKHPANQAVVPLPPVASDSVAGKAWSTCLHMLCLQSQDVGWAKARAGSASRLPEVAAIPKHACPGLLVSGPLKPPLRSFFSCSPFTLSLPESYSCDSTPQRDFLPRLGSAWSPWTAGDTLWGGG
jgi:hypothetical protein